MMSSLDFDDDMPLSEFEIKDPLSITKEIEKIIRDAEEVTCLPKGDTILVLRYFKWIVSRMNDVYYDDPDKYLALAHTQFSESEPPEEIECEICCDTVKDPIGLSCGHYFCKSCWKDHITGYPFGILDCPCMQDGCKNVITLDLVSAVSKILADRYMFFLKKDFIESRGNVFCPNEHCGRAIIILSSDRKTDNITCTCKQRFCFKCLKPYHSPTDCKDLDAWETVSSNDNYFIDQAKPCFHCGLMCERTTGCNHMTCPKCKGEWCWMCLGDWKKHGSSTGGFYSCNMYNAGGTAGNERDQKAAKSKEFHDKLKHFSDRYTDHKSLCRQSQELKEKNMPIIRQIYKFESRTQDRLEDAFDTLILARNFLQNSYIYAYFASEKNELTPLFNHQQGTIEHLTELLAGVLFKPIESYDIEDIATKASGLHRVIVRFS